MDLHVHPANGLTVCVYNCARHLTSLLNVVDYTLYQTAGQAHYYTDPLTLVFPSVPGEL